MDKKNYIRVVTKQNTFKINVLADLEQDGSLIKFFVDGIIELCIQTEDFLFCELVESND
jgi:hypothetical protein